MYLLDRVAVRRRVCAQEKLAIKITDFLILQTTWCQRVTGAQETLQGQGLVTGRGRGSGWEGKARPAEDVGPGWRGRASESLEGWHPGAGEGQEARLGGRGGSPPRREMKGPSRRSGSCYPTEVL